MIGILILGHKQFAEGLLHAVEHTFGSRPPAMATAGIDYAESTEKFADLIRRQIAGVDEGDGVVILADIFGTTHTNVACRFVEPGRVELISGANLPMVLRTLTYRDLPLDELVNRALTGGFNGIICAPQAAKESRPPRERGP
jgi:PTS system ascorbate-specific IIA component